MSENNCCACFYLITKAGKKQSAVETDLLVCMVAMMLACSRRVVTRTVLSHAFERSSG